MVFYPFRRGTTQKAASGKIQFWVSLAFRITVTVHVLRDVAKKTQVNLVIYCTVSQNKSTKEDGCQNSLPFSGRTCNVQIKKQRGRWFFFEKHPRKKPKPKTNHQLVALKFSPFEAVENFRKSGAHLGTIRKAMKFTIQGRRLLVEVSHKSEPVFHTRSLVGKKTQSLFIAQKRLQSQVFTPRKTKMEP